ncbi:MAG TPA: acid phosphatase [Lentisphaeria bacterium]|nr:MAG: hypothetical protein A2X47_05790 [Lentisphaerae bacterium GWF2_38_69]HBM16097.1 acid phosphatase [Lentisphaeria bacterium]
MTILLTELRKGIFLIFFIISLFSLLNLSANDKLIFAVTLIRHGDRTPTHDIKSDPYSWDIGKGELTALGMNQQNQLGAKMRERYVNSLKLLSEKYVNNQIYVRSTDFNRTIQSAESFLNGLYPLGLGPMLTNGNPALPAAYQPIPIRTLPVPMDNLLLAHDAQIDEFNKMCDKYLYSSDEWKIEESRYSGNFKKWSSIFGSKIQSIKDLQNIGDNLNVRDRNGVPFPNGLTEQEAKTIIYLSDWLQAQQFKPKEVGNFFGSEFLVKLRDDMQKAINNSQQYKYILYSGHDSSILPVLSALGVPLNLNPPYASHIDFELYKDGNYYCVQVLFNGKNLILPGEDLSRCSFENFSKIVEKSKP